MEFVRALTGQEIAAHFIEKLGGIDSRPIPNWIIKDVKITHTPGFGGNTYVRVSTSNLSGIIYFDDIRAIERFVKKNIRGATHFAMMSGTLFHPKFSFCL